MSAEEIYAWWFLWLGIGAVVVVAAAALLLTIVLLAHRIAVLAKTALDIVAEIQSETWPIWRLTDTNEVARNLLDGAEAIRDSAGAVSSALAQSDNAPRPGPASR